MAKSKFARNLEEVKKKFIESEDIPQSHRDNLQWAIEVAGHFHRTGQIPKTCPNNAAYFLFCQAVEFPKEFLTKFTQAEARKTSEKKSNKRAGRKTIKEIDKILGELKKEITELKKEVTEE